MTKVKTLKNFFRSDFTEAKDFLLSLPLGPLDDDDKIILAAHLGNLDTDVTTKGTWTVDDLVDSKVVYNGPNNTMLPTHPKFASVIGILLTEHTRVYLGVF